MLKEWELWDNVSPNQNISNVAISDAQDRAAVYSTDSEENHCIHFYQIPDFEHISEEELFRNLGRFDQGCFSSDGTRYAAAFKLNQGEGYLCTVCVFDVETGSLLYLTPVNAYKSASGDIGLIFLPGNDLMILQSESYHHTQHQYLYRLDKDTGKAVYTRKFSKEYGPGFDQKILLNETMLICVKGTDVLVFELETGKLLKCYTFSSSCEECFWLDDTHEFYVAVLYNGSVISYTLPNYEASHLHEEDICFSTDFELSEACGDRVEADYVCVIPKEDKCLAFIYRNQRDELRGKLKVPLLTESEKMYNYPARNMFLSSSGNRALYIVSDNDKAPKVYTIVLYDTVSMKEVGRYEVTEEIIRNVKGFSRDETKLIFAHFIFDLEQGTVTTFSVLEDLYVGWTSFQEPYIQGAGTPTIAAYFRNKDYDGFGELYWWEDGENHRGSVCLTKAIIFVTIGRLP